jgi:hypothetical protein
LPLAIHRYAYIEQEGLGVLDAVVEREELVLGAALLQVEVELDPRLHRDVCNLVLGCCTIPTIPRATIRSKSKM